MKSLFWGGMLMLTTLLQACFTVDIQPTTPPGKEYPLELKEDLFLDFTGVVNINDQAFVPSSFRIRGSKVIYVDPLLVQNPIPADYILITHNHQDHLSLADIQALATPDTKVICSSGCKDLLAPWNPQIVHPGERLDLGDFRLEVWPAWTEKPVFLWIRSHPQSDGNTGYVVEIDGQRLYFTGDTDALPELGGVGKPDVLVLPIGGARMTMDEADASGLTRMLGPRLVLPVHYKPADGSLDRFLAAHQGQSQVVDIMGPVDHQAP